MNVIHALILAIIEGLTEFLPVSSTGHLIIGSSLMGLVHDPFTKFFTVSIQFGCILSVLVLYWRDFLKNVDIYLKLLVAFIPAVIVGFLLKDFLDQLLESVLTVAVSLIVGGGLLLYVDKWFEVKDEDEKPLSFASAFKIGMFQCISMIPGVSRSAATIVGGLTQKLTRRTAAEFSFLLAVPTIFAASVLKLYKRIDEGVGFESTQVHLLIVGNVVAFLVGVMAIKYFINFLTKKGFRAFGYYRIIIGTIILLMYAMGYNIDII